MPKRKRRDKQAASQPEVDPQVALFARRHQEKIEAQKSAQRTQAEERRRAEEHVRLRRAKDAAVAALKAVRARDRPGPERVAEAEASYKAALAELMAFETGERPSWAPSTDPEPEPQAVEPQAAEPEPQPESTAEAEAEA